MRNDEASTLDDILDSYRQMANAEKGIEFFLAGAADGDTSAARGLMWMTLACMSKGGSLPTPLHTHLAKCLLKLLINDWSADKAFMLKGPKGRRKSRNTEKKRTERAMAVAYSYFVENCPLNEYAVDSAYARAAEITLSNISSCKTAWQDSASGYRNFGDRVGHEVVAEIMESYPRLHPHLKWGK